MPAYTHFYGRATKGLSEGLYKIYVTEAALCGAKVAGVVYDEASARAVTMHLGLFGFLIGRWLGRQAATKRAVKEQAYDAMEPGSPQFLSGDKANFSLGTAQINRARIAMPKGFLAKANTAGVILELFLLDGSKRTFSVPEAQSPEHLRALLTRLIPNIEMG